jgi:hypothetical protein
MSGKEIYNQQSLSHKKQIYIEFTRFFKGYLEAKDFLHNGLLLDSFSSIIQSLHHWAKLAIIEEGEHPEKTVWEQIKVIDSSVYKLYEELVTSTEPLPKRIELLLLALDFNVLSKMEKCVQFILDILKSRETPWTVAEVLAHPDIADPDFDVSLFFDKMVKRSLVHEHLISREGISEKCYSVS